MHELPPQREFPVEKNWLITVTKIASGSSIRPLGVRLASHVSAVFLERQLHPIQPEPVVNSPIARSPLRVPCWPRNLLNKAPLSICLRRVSSALRFLLPDCQGQRTVHV